jgi:tetratricopeptide (TPR) repeat protein
MGAAAPAFLSVAEDVTGPERPRAFAAGFGFPTVIDSQNVLGRLFDFDVVPNGVLLDPTGRIIFAHLGGFDVRRPELRARVEGLLSELAGQTPRGATAALPQRGIEVETYLSELAVAPDDASLWLGLADAQIRAGDDSAALDAYDRALVLAPSLGPAHFGRGTTLARLGQTAAAVEAWKAALRLDPANFVVRKQIWAHRHPERFWPLIDAEWQRAEMARERAGGSDLPPVP